MAESKRGEGDKAESMLGIWLSQRREKGVRLSQCWGEGDKAESKRGGMSESLTGGEYV